LAVAVVAVQLKTQMLAVVAVAVADTPKDLSQTLQGWLHQSQYLSAQVAQGPRQRVQQVLMVARQPLALLAQQADRVG
jgi:hypothetical protein